MIASGPSLSGLDHLLLGLNGVASNKAIGISRRTSGLFNICGFILIVDTVM